MSTPDIANILRMPGRLSHTPTDLAAAYPHGGTALGSYGKVDLLPLDPPFVVTAEEWGGAPWDLIAGGARWVLDAELREYDADALAILFPCYTTGAKGGAVLKYTANTNAMRAGIVAGNLLSRVLVFTPDSPDDLPLLILRRAVPAIQETARLALRGNSSTSVPVRWYATFDANKVAFDFGRRRDLTL